MNARNRIESVNILSSTSAPYNPTIVASGAAAWKEPRNPKCPHSKVKRGQVPSIHL